MDKVLLECQRFLLRPVVRYFLRNYRSFQDFISVAKGVFIDIAVEEMRRNKETINVSRLSVMTGLPRNYVTAIYRENVEPAARPFSLLSKVINQWENNPRYCLRSGRPRALTLSGANNEFRKLCESVSRHVHPGTVLFELERMKVIERDEAEVRLISPVSNFSPTVSQGFNLLSRDMEAFVNAVQENVHREVDPKNLHIHTEFDNLPISELPKIRAWLLEEGKAFHRRAREYLSLLDRDIAPSNLPSDAGRARVVVTAFSFTEELRESESEKKLVEGKLA